MEGRRQRGGCLLVLIRESASVTVPGDSGRRGSDTGPRLEFVAHTHTHTHTHTCRRAVPDGGVPSRGDPQGEETADWMILLANH